MNVLFSIRSASSLMRELIDSPPHPWAYLCRPPPRLSTTQVFKCLYV
jgi:hypothetical protein